MNELGLKDIPSALFCDNNSTLNNLAYNPRVGDHSKHIDVQYYFTRELVECGELIILRIDSNNNPVNIYTKALKLDTFFQYYNCIIDNDWEGILKKILHLDK